MTLTSIAPNGQGVTLAGVLSKNRGRVQLAWAVDLDEKGKTRRRSKRTLGPGQPEAVVAHDGGSVTILGAFGEPSARVLVRLGPDGVERTRTALGGTPGPAILATHGDGVLLADSGEGVVMKFDATGSERSRAAFEAPGPASALIVADGQTAWLAGRTGSHVWLLGVNRACGQPGLRRPEDAKPPTGDKSEGTVAPNGSVDPLPNRP